MTSSPQSSSPDTEILMILADKVENGQRLVMSLAYRIVLTDAEVDIVAAGLRAAAGFGHAQTPAPDNPLKAYTVEQLQYEIAWRLADTSTERK